MPLKVGNYWIYNNYMETTPGNIAITNTIDSVVIDKDTIINGKVFYKKIHYNGSILNGIITYSGPYYISYIRYEDGQLIDHNNRIEFSAHEGLATFHIDTVIYSDSTASLISYAYTTTGVMNAVETVDAGVFSCIENKIVVTDRRHGISNSHPDHYQYYAENVGKVSRIDYYLLSNKRSEKRLYRYKVE